MHSTLALLLIALALGPAAPARAQPVTPDPDVVVRWSMPDRFGPDADGDGRIDFPNTTAYVHNRVADCSPCPDPRFDVRFEAAPTAGLPVRSYAWTVTGEALASPLDYHRVLPTLDIRLPEGSYRVTVEAVVGLPWGSVSLLRSTEVVVEDLLVVAIGDSYASGEGNPEVRRLGPQAAAEWGDGGDAFATQAHARAHRSTAAWPARTALALEQADPHTSVTFISVATTAARIDHGLLTPQNDTTESQIDEVARLVGDRSIDLLLVQEGGNSIGFSRVVRALVEADPLFDPVCYDMLVSQALAAVRDGDWGRGTRVQFRLPFDWSCETTPGTDGPYLPGLDGLGAAFDRLDSALRRFDIDQVVLVGYPDPTGAAGDGSLCREIVGDVTPPMRFHEISRAEGRLGVTDVLKPLNLKLAEVAAAHGWRFVAGVDVAFANGHGYCAPWPVYGYPEDYEDVPGFAVSQLDLPDGWYRNPGRFSGPAQLGGVGISWYRTASQSVVLQGPEAPFNTSGTLHPNEVGHAAIARLVLARLGD